MRRKHWSEGGFYSSRSKGPVLCNGCGGSHLTVGEVERCERRADTGEGEHGV